ncbi:Hsp20/alpha crystallin family protein [Streptomyces poriferorum]|uniref:Hsp20/alpha crystallin family protein n=1 Tax=Streptomyces poriferorum TaxID=2798799 RepID=UPI00273FF5F4|nr:Hsp20/alpha crystallin family protein [Streptomyces sp. Alt1]WLQ46475.1 Hsp20/alpha crystallin family protein [Streptomyces sp. Alt1]
MTREKAEHRRGFLPDLADWFGSEFPGLPGWRPGSAAHSIPIEVSNQDGEYVLRAQLPGMETESDIRVTVDDNLITVHAEHAESQEEKEHSEFRYGSFRRTVRLPGTIRPDKVDAFYADGVLTVRAALLDRAESSEYSVPVKRGNGRGEEEPT